MRKFFGPIGSVTRLSIDSQALRSNMLGDPSVRVLDVYLPARLDRLIGEQRMPPVVVAFPDCFTRLGGNQYINSASTGAWEDYLLHEMLPTVEQRYGCGGTGRRGVFGKSSGGYGALTHALRHCDI